MQYQIINLFNLEKINVYDHGYYEFIGEKNQFINFPTNIKITKDNKKLIYLYYLDYDFYIPEYFMNNSCLILKDEFTLLVTKYKYKSIIRINRIENDYAFKIYYQRLNELRNVGLNNNILIFDILKENINGNEKVLINYCFEVLDNCNKDINILTKALLFLIDSSFKLHSDVELIKIIEEPCSNLQDSIYGLNWNIFKNMESILRKVNLSLVYKSKNTLNIDKSLNVFVSFIIEFYNYENELDYLKKYTYFID